MKKKNWMIILNLILIFILIRNSIATQAYIKFSPTATGEMWEHSFYFDNPTKKLKVRLQIGAFAKYNVTISLDSAELVPDSVICSYSAPPNHSLNNNPSIQGKTEEFYPVGGEKISFMATSSIHLGIASVYLRFDQYKNYTFPSDGISGKMTVQVVDLGLQDNSLYRTEFCLNSSQSSFEIEFDPSILLNAEIITYGKGAELKAVVSSTANSTGTVLLNLSDSYKTHYPGESYPQKYTTFQPMNVSPGTTQEQIFTMNNDEYDSFIHVPFSLSLINTSTTAFGNVTIYLEKLGKQYSANAESLGMILGGIGLVVIVRKKTKKPPTLVFNQE